LDRLNMKHCKPSSADKNRRIDDVGGKRADDFETLH